MRSTGQVAWADTDASGRIHFTAPFRWVEEVEHSLYRTTDPTLEVGAFPRRTVTSTYQRPLSAGEEFEVELQVERVGTSSIGYRWWVRRRGNVCVEGHYTVVHVGPDGSPAPVPETLRVVLGHHVVPSA